MKNKKNRFAWLMTSAALLAASASLAGSVNAAKKAYTGWKNTKSGRVYYQNGKKLKSTYLVKSGYVYYLKKNGVMIKSKTTKVKGKKVKLNKKGHVTSFRGKTKINGSWYYFTKKGAMVRNKSVKGSKYVYHYSKTGKLKSALSSLKGKKYFIDAKSAKPRTNFMYKSGSKWYYFDAKGLGSNSFKMQFSKLTGLVNTNKTFAANNKAYSYSSSSIDNVNGYITADSWYRPKKILKNGKTWTKSTATDKRPLLMVYWPSKPIFVDYLNFMKKNGFVSAKTNFTTKQDNKTLFATANTIQKNVEKKISSSKSTSWLKTLMTNFKNTESIWTKASESENYAGNQLQGGFLRYDNSSNTPWANSAYRLMGRYPKNIDGKSSKQKEFLLSNDIDNSNPIVQAEQLNWMYYLLNYGTITAKDSDANFDSVRVDAVDNVDGDLLRIAGQYFKDAYKMDSDATSNAHLNILEDWDHTDPDYVNKWGNPQITMDDKWKSTINSVLNQDPDGNKSLESLIGTDTNTSLVNRTKADGSESPIPNYTFIRAHDSMSQENIQQAIKDVTKSKDYPNGKDYTTFTEADELKGLASYRKYQQSTDKKYHLYNIPASYALLLSNKDTIPRVYYGDLFFDGSQYMTEHTIYYEAISNLLKSRIKYVAGGQAMDMQGDNKVLTSVRFGKGANSVSDKGTSETRTEGMGVIVSNKPDLKLEDGQKITLHMGAAHKNQKYRALLLTNDSYDTKNDGTSNAESGLLSYSSDDNAPTATTDDNGDLTFTNKNLTVDGKEEANTAVKGTKNPMVRGYLAVWVPVGAKSDQDARTKASTTKNNSGSAYRVNSAFDSNVIFEGFSNFTLEPKTDSDNANVKIAKNASLFKNWGVTSFELAPQYVSSTDRTFLDSTIHNGYAFTDRYDLALSKNNKYGSAEELRNAVKALHKEGMQVMADWVPDQVYSLGGKEAVTVTRVNDVGDSFNTSNMNSIVYIANSIGGGKYQKQYGGAFLSDLKKKYPDLFTTKQLSTGKPMDPSVKITEWSAKYMNGTNILHHGAGYVLRTSAGKYYNIGATTKDKDTNKKYTIARRLPVQLGSGLEDLGLVSNGKNYNYYNDNRKKMTSAFVQDSLGNWYYFDKNGNMVKNANFTYVNSGKNSGTYFFMSNGVSFRGGLLKSGKYTYYFDKNGRMVKGKKVKAGDYTYTLNKSGHLTSEKYTSNSKNAATTKNSLGALKTTKK
ncbi:glycoside hydrolase family 70 protein [Lactobacillus equicursoris]|uniref:glycoside hydrolase family 70 protein n=1 Tax=Lactobacillus equicursoris TaxID=420645 RepID=UPI003995F062